MDESKGLFRSVDGDVSSKRVAGFALVALGVGTMLAGGITQNAVLVGVGQSYLITGGGLLGVTAFEHIGSHR